MGTEFWVALVGGFFALGVAYVQFYLPHKRKNEPQAPVADKDAGLLDRLYADLDWHRDQLAARDRVISRERADHDATRSEMTKCLVQCERLKGEIVRLRDDDADSRETIRRLESEVRRLTKRIESLLGEAP